MSDSEVITFDTGNPLEGYGPPLQSNDARDPALETVVLTDPVALVRTAARASGEVRTAPATTNSISTMTWWLRPITPADETALIEFHERCSEETRYLRFAAAKPHLRPAEAHYLCGVDDHSRGALVIVASDDPGTIHGVGRWEGLNPTEAELAFVIEDACQGHGLGRKLVEGTLERAQEEGFTRLVTDVLQSNYRMRHLARDYGLEISDL